MIRQFAVSPELQQYLQASGSRALTNVVWNRSFTADDPLLPLSPAAVRRSITYTKVGPSDDATPTDQFDCYISALDGTSLDSVTEPRRL